MRLTPRAGILLSIGLVLLCSPVFAQISIDQVPKQRVIPLRESVEQQLEQSRWNWGPFRVDPELRLRNIGYNNNIFGTETDPVSDYTATVGFGVKSIAPMGTKTFLKLDVIPEYTWYLDLAERRNLGGEAAADLLFLFNRMSIDASGRYVESVAYVNSENEVPIPQTSETYKANMEVDIFKRLSLIAGVEQAATRLHPVEQDVPYGYQYLDRDEDAQRVGLRYKFRPNLSLAAVYETTSANFPQETDTRNNSSRATLLGLRYDFERFYVDMVIGNKKLEPEGSSFPPYDGTTGSAYISWSVFRRSLLNFTFARRPVYSTFLDNPYFIESRGGASLNVPLGNRLVLTAGFDQGKNEYQAPVLVGGTDLVYRSDDVNSWKAGIGFRVQRDMVMLVQYSNDKYDSNIGGYDRSIAQLSVNLALGRGIF